MLQVEPVVHRDQFGACACNEYAREACPICLANPAPVNDAFFPAHVGWAVLNGPGDQPKSRLVSLQRRQDEFLTGRRAAYRALRMAGFHAPKLIAPLTATYWTSVVGQNADRSPSWPSGFVGSISHSRNWVIAVAANASNYLSLGVDVEAIVISSQAELLQRDIGQPAEWSLLTSVGLPMPIAFTLLFSAKESFYKSWYPLHGRFLNFDDVVAGHIEPELVSMGGSRYRGLIHIHLKQADAAPQQVRYHITDNEVFTITTIDPRGS